MPGRASARQLVNLFVVHSDAPGAMAPAVRLERARLLLRTGNVEEAIAEIGDCPAQARSRGLDGAGAQL
jgi:hypothetical protein